MKKILVFVMVIMMVISLMLNTAYAATGRTRVEVTFAADFPYKDCIFLDAYGYEYDDGRLEIMIDISEFVTITMFMDESLENCGYRIMEHWSELEDREVFSVSGLSIEELDKRSRDEITNKIGEYLSDLNEIFGEL